MMALGAAGASRGTGGIRGPLHGAGRPGTVLDLLSPCGAQGTITGVQVFWHSLTHFAWLLQPVSRGGNG